eukprot:193523_1
MAAVELKVNDNDPIETTQIDETPTGCCFALRIFSRSLIICLLISFLASLYIALQYTQLLCSISSSHSQNQLQDQSTNTQWVGIMLAFIGLYLLFKLYLYFLELYTTFLFNTPIVKQYKIQYIIQYSNICTFWCSRLGQTIIVAL